MRRALVALFVCSFLSIPAFGQIVYEPLRYQYSVGDQTFYYGGSNPHLINFGYRHATLEQIRYGRNEFGSSFGQRYQNHTPVYSDLLPYRDMTDVGWTADDAANEALANYPRFWRKADALAAAYRDADGSVVVPAKGESSYVRPLIYPVRPMILPRPLMSRPAATNPAKRGEVIIIPKTLLDRPLKSFVKPGKQVASAN